eukprot:1114078-Pelagomonas_calceolata.AAC.3
MPSSIGQHAGGAGGAVLRPTGSATASDASWGRKASLLGLAVSVGFRARAKRVDVCNKPAGSAASAEVRSAPKDSHNLLYIRKER